MVNGTREYWDAFWASKNSEEHAKAEAAVEEARMLREKMEAADRRLRDLQRSADANDERVRLSHAIDQIRAILDIPQ